ncbi:helix-turn-helix transcriptional regulator [Tenacibaculum sp. AHE15PA]|uniref:helix-turn-helix domain-containing protein n=1 Tax=unclassified Tenacibaculum TaxID=2635139 RepID=UPI001C502194|nr:MULTISPECIES: helix-turn-helix transcriptional regulator [unclassified Tenacibaculum]QXP74666.1 helix-turn-helix transcriptional regulator [Tenacibaculum sp. AHE14PA]QXP76177.1 helix-turn-helix transcriptional regulator [Tenacibaculum sp. AHE15PA]
MEKNRKEIIAKLNTLTKGNKSQWLEDAKYRADNQEWLKKSQAIALKILRKLRENKTNQIAPSNQAQLASQLGVSAQQISKWVKGKENFTLETIYKLEAVLSISLMETTKAQTKILKRTSFIERVIMYHRKGKVEYKKRTPKKEAKLIPLHNKSTSLTNTNKYALQS